MISIAAVDPGKLRSSFFLVSLNIFPEQNKALVAGAMEWKRTELLHIESEISRFHQKLQWSNIFVEQNNMGEHVVEVLKREYNLPVKPIITTGKITDPRKFHNLKNMSKPEMVMWYLKAKQNHMIQFPEHKTREVMELERQIAIFEEHRTEAGNVAYYAPGEERDDGVMALLIACFAARKWLRIGEFQTPVMGQFKRKPPTYRGFDEFDRDFADMFPNQNL